MLQSYLKKLKVKSKENQSIPNLFECCRTRLKSIYKNTKESSTKQHKIHNVKSPNSLSQERSRKTSPIMRRKNQSRQTKPQIKHQSLREKNSKTAVVNTPHMVQTTEKIRLMVRRDMEDTEMT